MREPKLHLEHTTARAALLMLLALAGCTAPPVRSSPPEITQTGAMRAVMREGRSEARIDLDSIRFVPGVIAVGMEPGLAGEITACDGRCWTTRVVDRLENGSAVLETVELAGPDVAVPTEGCATMLTVGRVLAWNEMTLDAECGLDAVLGHAETLAESAGMSADWGFPLEIIAPSATVTAHVAAGACPHGDPEGAAASPPWRFDGETAGPVRIVGFRIVNGGGVSTHHGRRDHLHVLFDVDGMLVSAHLDDVTLPAGTVVRAPRDWV
jgi:hypothetical protein